MIINTKTFSATNHGDLDSQINRFINNNNIQVHDIKFNAFTVTSNVRPYTIYSAMILYWEDNDEI